MKALLVIDIQKSYITKYETDIVQRINERIIESQKAQYDIVYIKNTKKLRSGMVTDEFADDLILASDELPYEGAKEMLLVDEVDDKEFMTGLFNAVYEELPAPKPKKKK